MPDVEFRTRITGDQRVVSRLATIKKKAREVGVAAKKGFNEGRNAADQFSKKLKSVGDNLGAFGSAFLPISAGIGIAGAAIIKFGADFDKAMTESIAIMGDVSVALQRDMADAAKDVARTTTASASEAAEAFFFLASAGLDAEKSIAALPVVAQFAQAGAFDLALATDLLTDAQSAMGLSAKDATENLSNMARVSDILVKANTIANATVQQFSESLTNRAAAGARAAGVALEEVVATLAVFADQGVKGQIAGERFNIVLRDLQKAAGKNETAFKRLGISVFDVNGAVLPMADIIGSLEGALDGLSVESQRARLSTLGFREETISSLQSLVGTSEQLREYKKALLDAGGITKEVADKQMKAFSNRVTLMINQVQILAIEIFEGTLRPALEDFVLPAFEKLIRVGERVVKGLNAMPGPVKNLLVAFGGFLTLLAPLALGANSLLRVFSFLVKPAAGVAGAFSKLTGVAKPFMGVIRVLGPLMGRIGALVFSGPVGWIVGLTSLAVLLLKVTGNGDVLAKIMSALGRVGKAAIGILVAMFNNLKTSVGFVIGVFMDVVKVTVEYWTAVAVAVKQSKAFVAVASFLGDTFTVIADSLGGLAFILETFADKMGGVTEASKTQAAELNLNLVRAWAAVREQSLKAGKGFEDFTTQLDTLNADFKSGAITADEFAQGLSSIQQGMETFEPTVQGVNKAVEKTGEAMEGASKEIVQLRNDLASLRAEPENLITALKALDAENATLAERAKLVGDRVNGVVLALNDEGKAIDPLISELAEYIKVTKKAGKETLTMAEKLAEANKEFGAMDAQVKAFRDSQAKAASEVVGLNNRLKDLRNTIPNVERKMKILTERGASQAEIMEILGGELSSAGEFAKKFGIELTPATRALVEMSMEADRTSKFAKEWEDAWAQALGNVVSDFTKGFADMIFEGKRMELGIVGIFKNLGKTLFRIVTGEIFNPILKSFTSFAKNLSSKIFDAISGGNKGADFSGIGSIASVGASFFGGGGGGPGQPGTAGFVGPLPEGFELPIPELDFGKFGLDKITDKISDFAGKLGKKILGGLATVGKTVGGFIKGAGAFLLTNPIGLAITGIIGGFFLGKAIFGAFTDTPIEAGAKEVARDFGVKVSNKTVEGFIEGINLSEDAFKGIRKDVTLSPKFFEDILLPAAIAAGNVDELIDRMREVEVFGKKVDFGAAAAAAAEGDFTLLNEQWKELFENSEALKNQIPGGLDTLLSTTTGSDPQSGDPDTILTDPDDVATGGGSTELNPNARLRSDVNISTTIIPHFNIMSPSEDLANTVREVVWPELEKMFQKNIDGATEKLVRALNQQADSVTSEKL
jgi:TP901 family phage tail tape measure protein